MATRPVLFFMLFVLLLDLGGCDTETAVAGLGHILSGKFRVFFLKAGGVKAAAARRLPVDTVACRGLAAFGLAEHGLEFIFQPGFFRGQLVFQLLYFLELADQLVCFFCQDAAGLIALRIKLIQSIGSLVIDRRAASLGPGIIPEVSL